MSGQFWTVPCFPMRAPTPHDEAPLSRFIRRALENGFPIPWVLFKIAGFADQGSWTDPLVIDQIRMYYADSDGFPIFDWRRNDDGEIEVRVGGAWLPKKFVDFRGLSICPSCLENAPYRHALWDAIPYICCPYHGTFLIRDCPQCGASVAMTQSGIVECSCGYDLRKAPVCDAPLSVVEFHERMTEAAFETSERPLPTQSGPSSLDDLSLLDLTKLAFCLGPHPTDWDLFESPSGKPRQQIQNTIVGAAELVADWPRSFNSAIRSSLTISVFGALSVHWRNDAIYRAITHDLPEPQFDFLREGFQTVHKEVWDDYRTRYSESLADGSLQTDTPVGLSDAAALLGLKRREVKQLVRAGILSPTLDYDRRDAPNWVFDQACVLSLLTAFENSRQAVPANGYAVGLPFDKCRDAFSAFGLDLADLIKAVLDGTVPVVGESPKKAGLYRFDLRLSDALEFALSSKGSNETVSWRQVPAVLALPLKTCEWLVSNGILNKYESWPNEHCRVSDLMPIIENVILVRRIVLGSDPSLEREHRAQDRLNLKKLSFPLLVSPAVECPSLLCDRKVFEQALAATLPETGILGSKSQGANLGPPQRLNLIQKGSDGE